MILRRYRNRKYKILMKVNELNLLIKSKELLSGIIKNCVIEKR